MGFATLTAQDAQGFPVTSGARAYGTSDVPTSAERYSPTAEAVARADVRGSPIPLGRRATNPQARMETVHDRDTERTLGVAFDDLVHSILVLPFVAIVHESRMTGGHSRDCIRPFHSWRRVVENCTPLDTPLSEILLDDTKLDSHHWKHKIAVDDCNRKTDCGHRVVVVVGAAAEDTCCSELRDHRMAMALGTVVDTHNLVLLDRDSWAGDSHDGLRGDNHKWTLVAVSGADIACLEVDDRKACTEVVDNVVDPCPVIFCHLRRCSPWSFVPTSNSVTRDHMVCWKMVTGHLRIHFLLLASKKPLVSSGSAWHPFGLDLPGAAYEVLVVL